jgi:tripartite-type tricarboxylate transporter receptor subunit TctC
MKKIIAMLIALVFVTGAYSRETVSIVWPFSVGSNQVNYVRTLIEEANKQQTKYMFIVNFKPGAGGSIAANHVVNNKELTMITSSSSFFIRPIFYPLESHKVEDFRPVYIQCLGQPLAISSVKFKNLDELRNQQRLTIGVIPGSLTESGAREFRKVLPNVELDFIPYNGTIAILNSVLSNQIDLGVHFSAESRQWVDLGKLNIIGTSGTKEYEGFPTFQKQKIKGFEELVNNYSIMIPARYSDKLAEELHTIFRRAGQSSFTSLKVFYGLDHCSGVDYNWKQTRDTYQQWQSEWPKNLKN